MRRRALLLCGCGLALAACGRKKPTAAAALPRGSTVLALGDSITYGTGADAASSYPAQLAALTGWQVVNAGVPGNTAAQALERLPPLLAEHRPALVIVAIGGNDFLRRLPEAETESALRNAVMLARDAGARVVLVAIPQASVGAALGAGLSDSPLYLRLADELKLPLHAGGWSKVLGDDKLRADRIHANAAGYRAFAEGLAVTLRDLGLLDTRP